jgi:hypothetical protein
MRTEQLNDDYLRLVEAGFTAQEVYKAGPLFNPQHPVCLEAKQAVALLKVAREVERMGNRLMSQLVLARMDVRDASAQLWALRYTSSQRGRDYFEARAELAVLDAHDKLWAAQRMVALFEFTYGPTVEINP